MLHIRNNRSLGNSLAVQFSGLGTFNAGAWVRSRVRELRSHKQRGEDKKKKKKRKEIIGAFTGGIGKTVGENLIALEIFKKI